MADPTLSTPPASIFLDRLARFLYIWRTQSQDATEAGQILILRVICSTAQDAADYGEREEAERILRANGF